MSTYIIVDKSFLQGTSTARIRELAATSRLLVSDALFYELLTTDITVRKQCFSKFPLENNPVDLVSDIGPLLRREIEVREPAGKPSEHRENLDFDFRFNSALNEIDYELSPEDTATVEEHTAELKTDIHAYLQRVSLVPTFFPDLLEGTTEERNAAFSAAENAIAAPGALLPFYRQLESPSSESKLPPAEMINESWALYRWLQVQLLFAVDVFARYQGIVPDITKVAMYEKMEHDVLDAQVLMLACLEGAFATRENKLKRWWSLLCPGFPLYE